MILCLSHQITSVFESSDKTMLRHSKFKMTSLIHTTLKIMNYCDVFAPIAVCRQLRPSLKPLPNLVCSVH